MITLHGIRKTFEGDPPIDVLRGVDLNLAGGERVVIHGRSGVGKSTLLNILGLLDEQDSGSYVLDGRPTERLSARLRDRLRGEKIGFVFQAHYVIGHRTVRENLDLKLDLLDYGPSQRDALADRVLESVGLRHRKEHPGRLLSGGEKQRLALARAILAQPVVILADEPTGNLDDSNAQDVLALLRSEAERGAAVLVISHDERIGRWADRTLMLRDGALHGSP